MSSKSVRRGRVTGSGVALVLAGASLLLGCGGGKAAGAPVKPKAPVLERTFDATDILPGDLDLVARLDMGRMRSSLGPLAAEGLAARAKARVGDDDALGEAIACAEVLWVGARLGDLDGGDHVVVVEGPGCTPALPPARWEKVPFANGRVAVFDRRGDGAERAGTARVISLGKRLTAFVSPMEVDSTSRVLREGPDSKRGNPSAEGVLSVDFRGGRLPPSLERKYPSIGAVLGGIERVRGTAQVGDDGIEVEAEVRSPTEKGASRVMRFLEAVRDNVSEARLLEVMGRLKLEQVESSVRVRVVLPAGVVLGLLAGKREESKAGVGTGGESGSEGGSGSQETPKGP